MKRILIPALALISLCSCAEKEYDLCIYGGNASGVVAAYSAATQGLDVVVVEPTCRIGGMVTGGLGLTDIGNKQVVKGVALQFFRKLGIKYGTLESWVFEPSAAKEILDGYLDNPHIKVVTGYHFCDAVKEGTDIRTIRVAGGENSLDTLTFKAKWFIDASYEGDLMAGAGVSYRTGREDNSEYGETWDGVQLLDGHQFPDGVDPFVEPGNPESGLLWGISTQKLYPDGTGDALIQAYNYRICLTDSVENMIPIAKPDNYDPSKYELLLRLYDAQKEKRKLNDYFIWSRMPNRKTDINNRGGFSTDMIGMNYDYAEGTWERRQEIIKAHKDYTLGLLYFTANDPRVPEELRNQVSQWGLPKDEYTECGHWSPQLYIRECRRLVGEYVATQADCDNRVIAPNGIAMAAYTMDSHNCQRIVVEKDGRKMVKNEGNAEIHGGLPYPISYKSLTPKREECTNLLVPVCCSASHIAYGSIRMEPVFMCMGQAAGLAVALAEKQGLKTLQEVDSDDINAIVATDPYLDGTTPDIIIDDDTAEYEGEWEVVKSTRGFGPSALTGSEGCVKYSTVIPQAGEYAVYTYQRLKAPDMNPESVFTFGDGSRVTVNVNDVVVVGQTSSAWHHLKDVTLSKDEQFTVILTPSEGDGKVYADAILLVRK